MIRPVQPGDKGEWLRLRLALWPDADPEEQAGEIATFFATPPRPPLPNLGAAFVCARPDGGLCGLVEVSIHHSAPGCYTDHIGYLEAWYVDADWRGRGVGRALAERAEAWAREEGCTEIASDTTPEYPSSPDAHAALGYREVERYFRKDLPDPPLMVVTGIGVPLRYQLPETSVELSAPRRNRVLRHSS